MEERMPEDAKLNEEMTEVFVRAIRHAEEVCRREHIKAVGIDARLQRAGIFVNCFKEALKYSSVSQQTKRALVEKIGKASVWFDIGEINEAQFPNFTSAGYSYSPHMSGTRLKQWLYDARKRMPQEDDYTIIKQDLEYLERQLPALESPIREAQVANEEADVVMAQFVTLFDE